MTLPSKARYEYDSAPAWIKRDLLPSGFIVYRLFGAKDELLYVGCTSKAHLQERVKQHYYKPWFPSVVRAKYESFTNAQAASDREEWLIANRHPKYNRRSSVYARNNGLGKKYIRSPTPFSPSELQFIETIKSAEQAREDAYQKYVEAVLAAVSVGMSYGRIAQGLGIERGGLHRWVKRRLAELEKRRLTD